MQEGVIVARKTKSFADKALSRSDVVICPVCGEEKHNLVVVEPKRNPETENYRYSRNKVKVCKCNENEVYA